MCARVRQGRVKGEQEGDKGENKEPGENRGNERKKHEK